MMQQGQIRDLIITNPVLKIPTSSYFCSNYNHPSSYGREKRKEKREPDGKK
jgi:hypothetical protein